MRSPVLIVGALIVGSFVFVKFVLGGAIVESKQDYRSDVRPDFENEVHPIFEANCQKCHNKTKRAGGLSLATYEDALDGGRSGAAIKPGNSASSLLVERIIAEVDAMPPRRRTRLRESEVRRIRSWIDDGARATLNSPPARARWEAPLALERPVVPDQVWTDWSAPLDRFAAAYLATQKVAEPALVSDNIFARRAYLDIWGLLPPPNELQRFIADTSPTKRAELVKRLLADGDKYAQHWISFWNDLLRNDEGVNYHSETASRKSISDWLLASLESNLPYDKFAAKLLNPVDLRDPGGFLAGVNWRGAISASQTPAMQAAQNTAQIFLGVNLKCNSCHDSFISKWKLKDAYGLASFFSEQAKLQLFRAEVAQEQFAGPAFLFSELNQAAPSDSLIDRRATAAAIFTDPRNGRFPRTLVNRVWHRLFGRGLVENPDEMDGEPWSPALLDWLASDFVDHGYDIKHLIGTIVTSRAYQMQAVPHVGEQQHAYEFRGPEIRRLTAEQFADSIASITGLWQVYQAAAPNGASADMALSPGSYAREWRVAANALTQALGRPIRDQVYSSRNTQATMLQGLELVNGSTLTHWLQRGARQMLGELPAPPNSRFAAPMLAGPLLNGAIARPPAAFDIDVTNATKLWLIVQDTGSMVIDKVEAVWADAAFVGPNGTIPLSELKPVDSAELRAGIGPVNLPGWAGTGVRATVPSRIVYDIADKGFTRFRGMAGLENVAKLTKGESVEGRFFIFDREPDMDRLVPPAPATPLPPVARLVAMPQVIDRIFWYALGRAPSAAEQTLAAGVFADPARTDDRPTADGLADLLWAVLMKPEFQLIY